MTLKSRFDRSIIMNRDLYLLFVVTLVFAISTEMVDPLFPLFIQDLGGSTIEIGLLLFLGGVSAVMLMILSGFLSDRYGKKTMIMLALFMQGVSPVFLSLSTKWAQAVPAAIVFIASLGMFQPPSMAYIADGTSQKTRGKVYGFMNLAWPLAMIPGPFLAGYLADHYGWNYCFYIVTCISFVCLVPAFLLNEPRGSTKGTTPKVHRTTSLTRQGFYLVGVFSFIQFFGNAARGILSPVVPLYLTDKFQVDKTQVGLFFSIGYGLAILISQIPAGIIADRYGRRNTMVYAISLTPFISVLWPWLDSYALLTILYMSITGLWSVTWPASTAYLMDAAPAERRATVAIIREASVRLGFTAGPIIGGYLWEVYDPATTFYVSAGFFALSFLLAFFLKE